METTLNEYDKQAKDFLESVGGKIKIVYLETDKYFPEDKEVRDIYHFTLSRKGKSYTGRFGQSINASHNGEEPTEYDILACVTKNDPGTFENFCSDYGYDTDSISATKTYKGVLREWKGVERVFGDVLEKLQEIS